MARERGNPLSEPTIAVATVTSQGGPGCQCADRVRVAAWSSADRGRSWVEDSIGGEYVVEWSVIDDGEEPAGADNNPDGGRCWVGRVDGDRVGSVQECVLQDPVTLMNQIPDDMPTRRVPVVRN